jgi:hypothetical protein
LLFLTEKGIEKTGVADVMTEFAMLQKYMHAFP